ncbi:MAG: penicillin-insensitive murein endopeptidase [Pseudomonadota bacterium]
MPRQDPPYGATKAIFVATIAFFVATSLAGFPLGNFFGKPSQEAFAQSTGVIANPVPRPPLATRPPDPPAHANDQGPVRPDAVARQLFGSAPSPAPLAVRSIGSYAKGCLAGAVPLAVDGPSWQAMRLSRNRNWGHPALVQYLQELASSVRANDDWNGLLVGDMSQPRGGPMLTGHRSHQIGLDADIWLTPMPDRILTRQEREEISATSMLRDGTRQIDPTRWSDAHARIIKRAASDDRVARIFVHPAIKQQLCNWEQPDADRAWLRQVRPWYGHHFHFHVRLWCPDGAIGCVNQDPPPVGDGCGADLDWWLGPEPWEPSDAPVRPRRETRLADLPAACTRVLVAN